MRSLKSGLLGCLVAGLFGTFAVVGCSASGDTGDFGDLSTDTDPTEEESTGTALPPSNPDTNDESNGSSKADAGKKDAGKDAGKDAAKDAGPPPPDPGAACAKANDIFKRSCLTCGTQEAVCLANADGTSGGTVSPYGECKNQVVDGCLPGSTEEIACGNCGTQKRTCNAFCGWSVGQCTGQPASSCTPGSVELLSAGCDANTYRQKTCKTTCTWDNISATCAVASDVRERPPDCGKRQQHRRYPQRLEDDLAHSVGLLPADDLLHGHSLHVHRGSQHEREGRDGSRSTTPRRPAAPSSTPS